MPRGNGKSHSAHLLENVVAELRGLREDTNAQIGGWRREMQEGFAKVDARLERVDERLGRVEEATLDNRQELRRVNDRLGVVADRLENIRDLSGEQYRALETRVARLEQRSEPG